MSVTVTLILNQVQEIQGPYLRSVDAGSSPAWRFTDGFWAVTMRDRWWTDLPLSTTVVSSSVWAWVGALPKKV